VFLSRWIVFRLEFGAGMIKQRFINLIDVLVDADVPVDFFAAVDLDDF